jgi:hypothetical protein
MTYSSILACGPRYVHIDVHKGLEVFPVTQVLQFQISHRHFDVVLKKEKENKKERDRPAHMLGPSRNSLLEPGALFDSRGLQYVYVLYAPRAERLVCAGCGQA